MKAFVMWLDTAKSVTQWYWRPPSSRYSEPLRRDLTEAEHVVVNSVDRGHQPRTIYHDEQWCWVKPEVNHGVVTCHTVTLKKENQRRNHSQRACGEKNEVKQQVYEDRTRRTSKIWSNDEKNREEQSQQQAEEHGQQQAKRTKGLRPRQGEVRGKIRHRGKLQPASPEASKKRCRCPAGTTGAEIWRSLHDPSQRSISTWKPWKSWYKTQSFTVQKNTEVIHRKRSMEERRSIVT